MLRLDIDVRPPPYGPSELKTPPCSIHLALNGGEAVQWLGIGLRGDVQEDRPCIWIETTAEVKDLLTELRGFQSNYDSTSGATWVLFDSQNSTAWRKVTQEGRQGNPA